MINLEIRKLKAFGKQIQIDTARDMNLLRKIEDTLDALDIECGKLQQLNNAADYFIDLLNHTDIPFANSDVNLVKLFESARDKIGACHEKFSDMHLCAVNAPELNEDDGVAEAYMLLLTDLAALHDKLNSLAWIIREQEADQDKTASGVFTNAEDLFAAMGV